MPDRESYPEQTIFEFLPIDQVRSPLLKIGVAHWQAIRGSRLFPAREDLKVKAVAGALNHLVLMKVLDAGADFEFRIVGDCSSRSFKVARQGRKLSDIAAAEPYQAMRLASLYRFSVDSKAPVYVRGTIGHDATAAKFTHFEAVVLPMGPDDETVDHLLGFGVYTNG